MHVEISSDVAYLSTHESSHTPFKSDLNQSHIKVIRVRVESSQSRFTKTVESLVCKLGVMSSQIKIKNFPYVVLLAFSFTSTLHFQSIPQVQPALIYTVANSTPEMITIRFPC